MKKMITMAAITVFGLAAAQENTEKTDYGFAKGTVFIEGQLSFSSGKTTAEEEGVDLGERKISNVTFSPKAGYFFTDKLAAGIEFSILSGKQTTISFSDVAGEPDEIEEMKGNGFSANIFARYYFLKLGKRFDAYTELGAGFGSIKEKETKDNETETTNVKGFSTTLDLGFNYFVTPKVAISFTLANVLAYSNMTIENDQDQSKATISGFSGDLNVFKNFFDTPTFGLLYQF